MNDIDRWRQDVAGLRTNQEIDAWLRDKKVSLARERVPTGIVAEHFQWRPDGPDGEVLWRCDCWAAAVMFIAIAVVFFALMGWLLGPLP